VELKINAKSDKYWEVELVGEDRSLPNMIAEALHGNSDVEFAASILEHPTIGSPKIIIRTKNKKAGDALLKAIEEVEEQLKEFKTKFKKAAGKGK